MRTPQRSKQEILQALEEYDDKIWYYRHLDFMNRVESGEDDTPADIVQGALEGGERIKQKYGEDQLGPWTDFELGMLHGKLSALRWVMGDEWDMLDT